MDKSGPDIAGQNIIDDDTKAVNSRIVNNKLQSSDKPNSNGANQQRRGTLLPSLSELLEPRSASKFDDVLLSDEELNFRMSSASIKPKHKRIGQVRHVHTIRAENSLSTQSSSENGENSLCIDSSPDSSSSCGSYHPLSFGTRQRAGNESPIEAPNLPPTPRDAKPLSAFQSIRRHNHFRRHNIQSERTSTCSGLSDEMAFIRASMMMNDTISLPPSFKISSKRRFLKKSPGLPYTSSEESTSSEPIHGSSFLREEFYSEQRGSRYKNLLHLLTHDVDYQKEVALGKRIGFYRLGKEIGVGNFSKVKIGVHVLTKEKVAIKIMEKSKMDQKAQRLLMREIANMELMHHPNIIRLFECVETFSKIFLIMEYAGNGELYTYVQQNGKLSEETAKPIFAQLVSAVTHLHTKGIAHRDIKAENVIFSQPGWVKLADFGFSCKYEMGNLLNTFCGSPPYAAPELFTNEHYDGFKVDIWALGVLLYFMLVGITPFRGETLADLKQNIVDVSYTIPEYVSTFAQHLFARMIRSDIAKRSSILELRRAYWLKNNKFPNSYLQLSLNPDEDKLETNELERKVWSILKDYGISETMIREASDKGSRNSIIGTYRIVLYQCQAKDRDEERMRLHNHILLLSKRNRQLAEQMKQQSTACTIL